MTRTRECDLACPATCSPSPITALPSVRIGSLDHIVLGFSVSNACTPECSGIEPCYNIGVSFRWRVGGTTQAATGPFDCDLEQLSSGATFNANYLVGGSDQIIISNATYLDCGGPPVSCDVLSTGKSLGIQSHFELAWVGDVLVGYTETRSYTNLPSPNTVTIAVTNIDYLAHTYDVSVQNAATPNLSATWGQLKVRYR